jgi:hypothetical protein
VPHDQTISVEYIFVSSDAQNEFQGDVRGKTLIRTWDFSVLWSSRISRQNGGEAVLQDLKIWKDRQPPYYHTFSFFTTTREMRHLEFPLLSFQRDVKSEPNQPLAAHIDFMKQMTSSSSTDPRVRRTFRPPSLLHGKSPPKGNPSQVSTLIQ